MDDLQPHWQNERVTLYQGDALETLKRLPDESVHCCVTSPPYFGLRDYGVEGQIGLEPTPDEYIANLVSVFREVRRVLRSDGTLWVNIGDSYAGSWGNASGHNRGSGTQRSISRGSIVKDQAERNGNYVPPAKYGFKESGIKQKDLIGIPWMLAFALRSDGWFLRQDIVWNKPNPMPESVTDRCTKSHEYIFLFSKSAKYFYDHEAIKDPIKDVSLARLGRGISAGHKNVEGAPGQLVHSLHSPRFNVKFGGNNRCPGARLQSGNNWLPNARGANKRSVWTVSTKPYRGAHFATFPPDLIDPCVKAGCPQDGIVLDPFAGSGTSGQVAAALGRNAILIELNQDYCELIKERVVTGLGKPKATRKPKPQEQAGQFSLFESFA